MTLSRTVVLSTLLAWAFISAAPDSLQAAQSGADLVKSSGVAGGLVVHLGCSDGDLTAGLRVSDAYLVHGLTADPAEVRAARRAIAEKGLYGGVSVDRRRGKRLPYADHLVNLLVVSDAGDVPRDELLRVLAPLGVLLEKDGDQWRKTVKPWSKQMDQWTHYLHGPDGNAVAKDELVGPPKHLQWIGGPRFSRGHEQQASFSSCVSAGGRLFYIVDEAPAADIRLPAQWNLVARDAFNGIVLWKRPMGQWVDHFRRFRSGPASLQFRLVASGDHVFITFDFEGPVSILDAATGQTLHVVKDSAFTKQIVHRDGQLLLLIDEQVNKLKEIDEARRRGQFIPHRCRLLKVNARTGKTTWSHDIDELVFPSVAWQDGRVFAQTSKRVVCLDDKTGKPTWEAPFAVKLNVSSGKLKQGEMQWEAPGLLVGEGVVYAADFAAVRAYDVRDGKTLWSGISAKGYNAPPDMHLVGGLFWMQQKGKRTGYDPRTGEVKKQLAQHGGYMHARCYRNKATENYLMMGLMGVQMLDLSTGEIWDNDWIRGTCQYGILPANGLLYVPPDSCGCNMKTKLSGLYALAAQRQRPAPNKDAAPPLEKGPAFGQAGKTTPPSPDDWPTFRGTPGRQGVLDADMPTRLTTAWSAKIGGKLSSVTIADGQAFVAAVNQHTVHAVSIETGKTDWTFTAGGRIDSPPTVHQGVAYFGSADGWVYAVRANDGELVWRLRAAPDDRLVCNLGQLESAWPVHGSVLIHQGELKVAAGRSSYLDGGIHLYRLEPATGAVLSRTVIYSPDAEGKQPTGGGKDVYGALDDILLADGDDVYMRHVRLDFATGSETSTGKHLFSPIGMLDDTWWHRAYWLMGDKFQSHWSGWWKVGNQVPSGRIMSYDAKAIIGFGRDKYPGGNTGQWRGGEAYQLFAIDRQANQPAAAPAPKVDRRGKRQRQAPKPQFKYEWTAKLPLLARGMVVSRNAIFTAGPPDVVKTQSPTGNGALQLTNAEEAVDAWYGRRGGQLHVNSRSTGEAISQAKLPAPPVFDGVAAAQGRLFLALTNGTLLCMKASE